MPGALPRAADRAFPLRLPCPGQVLPRWQGGCAR